MGKTSPKSVSKWQSRNYDRVVFYLRKGEKEKLSTVAVSAGVSVSRYLVDSVNLRIPGLLSPLDDESKKKKPLPDEG